MALRLKMNINDVDKCGFIVLKYRKEDIEADKLILVITGYYVW